MTPPFTFTSRHALLAVLFAGALATSVGGCGRRGRPEPPSQGSSSSSKPADTKGKASAQAQPGTNGTPAAAANPDDDDDDDTAGPTIAVKPPVGRKKAMPYVVPKEPFILDPLL